MPKPEALACYIDIRHDITPPGHFRGRGYWVDKEWNGLLLERPDIAVLQGKGNNKRLGLFVGQIKSTRRHYDEHDRCSVCLVERPTLRGKCHRCYHRDYMRVRALSHNQKMGLADVDTIRT